ncbi:hypothetical protein C8J56DRAFT_964463 [Mycena floridula]|nr:hypothetical protein C8J56DRAFT_964463 [Mycena floridula]
MRFSSFITMALATLTFVAAAPVYDSEVLPRGYEAMDPELTARILGLEKVGKFFKDRKNKSIMTKIEKGETSLKQLEASLKKGGETDSTLMKDVKEVFDIARKSVGMPAAST